MKIAVGQTVYKGKEQGIVTAINNSSTVMVDFGDSERRVVKVLLKSKPPKQKKKRSRKVVAPSKPTFQSVVNGIQGSRQERSSMFGFADIYEKIEQLSFNNETGESELAGKIVSKASKGEFITNKQACVVAFFAKENGLI